MRHLRASTSPWNFPVIVIKKANGSWRLIHDLRKINERMIPFSHPPEGPPMDPSDPYTYHLIIIGIKECFFSVSLHPEDSERFAFSIPSGSRRMAAAPARPASRASAARRVSLWRRGSSVPRPLKTSLPSLNSVLPLTLQSASQASSDQDVDNVAPAGQVWPVTL